MSVVNDMLKDLERRRADSEQTVALDGMLAAPPPPGERLRALMWAALGGAVALAAAGAWQWMDMHRSPIVSTTKSVTVVPAVPAPANQAAQTVATARPLPARRQPQAPAGKLPADGPKGAFHGAGAAPALAVMGTGARPGSAPSTHATPLHTKTVPDTPASSHTPARHASAPGDTHHARVHRRATAKPRHHARASVGEPRASHAQDHRPQPSDGVTKQMLPLSPRDQARQLYVKALERMQRGNLLDAEALLRRALALAPDSSEARASLAALLIQQNRQTEAAALLVAGLRSQPGDPDYAKLYGRLLAGEGHTKQAVMVMETALPAAGNDPGFHALLAALYQRLGRNREAAAQYRSALSSQPAQAVWWMGLGISLENLQADQQAAAAYQQALALPGLDNRLRDYVAGRLRAVGDGPDTEQVTP